MLLNNENASFFRVALPFDRPELSAVTLSCIFIDNSLLHKADFKSKVNFGRADTLLSLSLRKRAQKLGVSKILLQKFFHGSPTNPSEAQVPG